MLTWIKTVLNIKKLFQIIALVFAAIYVFTQGKRRGVKESQDKIRQANKRAEKERDNVEDVVRNTPDTVVDDELDPFMRD